VVLVGPNNAGKSVALREVSQAVLWRSSVGSRVVTATQMHVEGTAEEFEEWLDTHAVSIPREHDGTPVYRRLNWGLYEKAVAVSDWQTYVSGHAPQATQIGVMFCLHAASEARLGLVQGGVPPHDPTVDGPSSPMQAHHASARICRPSRRRKRNRRSVPLVLFVPCDSPGTRAGAAALPRSGCG
jgi:hypothetical protein